MPRDDGRIVIVSDLPPKKLLRIAEEIARDSECGLDDLEDRKLDGFEIYDANGSPPVYTILSLARSATGNLRVPLDIRVTAGWTKKDEGRIVLDWIETGNALRSTVCRDFTRSLADEIEDRIDDAGGRVFESYDD
jgi:hypothetical protein